MNYFNMNYFNIINLKLLGFKLAKSLGQHRADILIALALGVAIAIPTHIGTYQIPDPVITDFYAQDVWFGSDIPTVFGNITDFNSDFGRNNKHPLFPLLIFPLVFGLSKLLLLDVLTAVRLLVVLAAAGWVAALYALLRCMGLQRLDATLFTLLGGVSAASVFWLVIPESFSFGSLTIILGLLFATLAQYRPFSTLGYVLLNVMTVSITITNAMVGIFTTVVNHRWRQVIQIGIAALALSTALWVGQRVVFTNSGFPFQPGTFIGEKKFVSVPGKSGLLAMLSSFFYQTMVMPATTWLDSSLRPDWVQLESNVLNPLSGGLWGAIAVVTWTGLLLLGIWGFGSTQRHLKLRIVLGLTLAAQLVMHSIYGVEETFIYSLHFIPLLVMLAAFSLFTPLRLVSLALAGVLIISAGINNRSQFNQVATALWNYGTPHQQVAAQMKLRPQDPWLRSEGPVVLAQPGSAIAHKAFHQPGGSFSPAPDSFGVSIWVVDRQGRLQASSDSLPLKDIQQRLLHPTDSKQLGIVTQTPYYQASWSATPTGGWQLDLEASANQAMQPLVVFRSVGPAGGALTSLKWDGQVLSLGDHWQVKNIPTTARVYLGSEQTPGWTQEKNPRSEQQDPYGWGYARIELAQGAKSHLVLENTQSTADAETGETLAIAPGLEIDLPNAQFTDSFNAQIRHLLMGLVGTRTRPTDPLSYPLSRFRDGAYQMVALARAGQLEVAKQLSTYFAETDWVNGFLPEADIPALGVWALTEVADSIRQPAFDQQIWPHVRRKIEIIENLLSSNRPGYPILEQGRLPNAEYPDLLRVDLIGGKMDNAPHTVTLNQTANAISYRALLNAAELGDRLNQSAAAKRWRSQAEQMRLSWQERSQQEVASLTDGLWPTWIAASEQTRIAEGLEQHLPALPNDGEPVQPPSQTPQHDLATAHQWLYLGQPDRVWQTLKGFWQHQGSPGLYTWAAPSVELGLTPEHLSQWHRVRGWFNPSQITPHHWTAAEMALLQIDMLAYLDRSTPSPTLVLGAGVLKDWLRQPMSVKGLRVAGQRVNWAWDGKQVMVEVTGDAPMLRLGSVFPAGTPIKVTVMQPTTPLPKSNDRLSQTA